MASRSRVTSTHYGVTSRRGIASVKAVSFALVALALYGDLLKRLLPPNAALAVLYAAATTILVAMVSMGSRRRHGAPSAISTLAGLLIIVYAAQTVGSVSGGLVQAVTMAAYIGVPLSFLFIIPRVYPQFDLRAVAIYTAVLIIPIHVIGFAQQFVSPNFMISTAYSGAGGIVERNFLEAGSFSRFPSIFASADRYAGVSMMQVFLTFVLLAGPRSPTRGTIIWVAVSLLAGGAALLIAGARSRIVMVVIALAAAGIAMAIGVARRRLSTRSKRIGLHAFVITPLVFVVAFSIEPIRQRIADLPVLSMLEQTVAQNDVARRLAQSIDLSRIPDNMTLFGEGLGVAGEGRPGEFGIRAMWIESGYAWTPIMLALYFSILALLARDDLRAVFAGDGLLTLLLTGSAVAWLFGLLGGLSGTFELSQALLLFPTIAVITSATTSWQPARWR